MQRSPVVDGETDVTLRMVWSPRWKRYDVVITTYSSASGRAVVRTLKMEHELRPEIDADGAMLLALAVIEEYSRWLL